MGERKMIMVIDDASMVRLYYRTVLEAAGFDIEEATNGVEALEKVEAVRPDLLIVDVNMPQMDGLTFLSHLRLKPLPFAGIPALVISTESADRDAESARRAGANYFLVKPMQPDLLASVVALLCGEPR